MAKWGEGDPRWIVEERPDSTNVNNWHWTEKNCFPWADQYLRRTLADVSLTETDGTVVKIKSVSSIEGDVTLGNRKGKVYNLYDLEISLVWEGHSPDGVSAEGTFKVTNVTQDEDVDDYNYEITCYDETQAKRKLKETAKTKLLKLIKVKLDEFVKDLKAEFASKVLLPTRDGKSGTPPPSQPPGTQGPAAASPPVTAAPAAAAKTAAKAVGKSLSFEVELLASAQDVFEAMTQQARVQIWTQAEATVSAAEGAELRLYGGNVSGKTLSTVPNKSIRQEWRLQSWPAGHYSQVTFELDQGSASTTVRVKQTNIPEEHDETLENDWHRFYFDRMKTIFGWGVPVGR